MKMLLHTSSPELCPLPEPILSAQEHAMSHVLHGPQLVEQTQVQHRQDQKTTTRHIDMV